MLPISKTEASMEKLPEEIHEHHQSSFAPSEITRSTFSRLLACYPATTREVYKGKNAAKLRPKTVKKPLKRPAQIEAADADLEAKLEQGVETFLRLDEWRYSKLPTVVEERGAAAKKSGDQSAREPGQSSEDDSGACYYLEKNELIELVDWKLKHGVFRPALLGLVKSNQDALVRKTTAAAFAAIPYVGPTTTSDDAFPKVSLELLTGGLRGAGPATASLILSVASSSGLIGYGNEIPFYSDELYLWLCLNKYSSGDKAKGDDAQKQASKQKRVSNLKYNVREYQQLWDVVAKLRTRLNKAVQSEPTVQGEGIFSVSDIEKVAYVIGHIDVSGYFGGEQQPGLSILKSPHTKPSLERGKADEKLDTLNQSQRIVRGEAKAIQDMAPDAEKNKPEKRKRQGKVSPGDDLKRRKKQR